MRSQQGFCEVAGGVLLGSSTGFSKAVSGVQ